MVPVRRNLLIFAIQFVLLAVLLHFEARSPSVAHRLTQGTLIGLALSSLIWANYRHLIYPYLLTGRYGAYLARVPVFWVILLVFFLVGIAWTDESAHDLPTYLHHITSLNYYLPQWKELFNNVVKSGGTNVYFTLISNFIITTLLALVYAFFEIHARRRAIQRKHRQAELAALRAQISPHFFFNALNTVYGQALTEGHNELAEQLQALATRAREMNQPLVTEAVTGLDHHRPARLTAFLVAGAMFLYHTLDNFAFYYDGTQQTVWQFLWYKILLNPAGALFRSFFFALLTWLHYQYSYLPYFLTKRYFHYLAGLGMLLVVHWALGLARMFFSLYLHLHGFPNQGFEYVDVKAWGLSKYATGLQIWDATWNLNARGGGSFQLFMTFAIIYFVSGWLYQTIVLLVENQKLQNQQRHTEQRQQADAQQLTAQLKHLAVFSGLKEGSRAVQSLSQVTDLMTYVTQTATQSQVPVADELQFLRDYIAFQRKRIPDDPSIQINGQIRYDGQSAQLAPMLLIPFIENAFQYGIQTDGPCFIELELVVENRFLRLQLINSVVPKTVFRQSSGIGLANVRKRLELLYADRYTLSVGEVQNEFRVALTLQLSA